MVRRSLPLRSPRKPMHPSPDPASLEQDVAIVTACATSDPGDACRRITIRLEAVHAPIAPQARTKVRPPGDRRPRAAHCPGKPPETLGARQAHAAQRPRQRRSSRGPAATCPVMIAAPAHRPPRRRSCCRHPPSRPVGDELRSRQESRRRHDRPGAPDVRSWKARQVGVCLPRQRTGSISRTVSSQTGSARPGFRPSRTASAPAIGMSIPVGPLPMWIASGTPWRCPPDRPEMPRLIRLPCVEGDCGAADARMTGRRSILATELGGMTGTAALVAGFAQAGAARPEPGAGIAPHPPKAGPLHSAPQLEPHPTPRPRRLREHCHMAPTPPYPAAQAGGALTDRQRRATCSRPAESCADRKRMRAARRDHRGRPLRIAARFLTRIQPVGLHNSHPSSRDRNRSPPALTDRQSSTLTQQSPDRCTLPSCPRVPGMPARRLSRPRAGSAPRCRPRKRRVAGHLAPSPPPLPALAVPRVSATRTSSGTLASSPASDARSGRDPPPTPRPAGFPEVAHPRVVSVPRSAPASH